MTESNLPPDVTPEDVDEAMGDCPLDRDVELDNELADDLEYLAELAGRIASEPRGEVAVTAAIEDTQQLISHVKRVAKMLRARQLDIIRSSIRPLSDPDIPEFLDKLIEAAEARVRRLGFIKRAYVAKFIREIDP